jgi:hypothetical protein
MLWGVDELCHVGSYEEESGKPAGVLMIMALFAHCRVSYLLGHGQCPCGGACASNLEVVIKLWCALPACSNGWTLPL